MPEFRETLDLSGKRYEDAIVGLNAYIEYVAQSKIDAALVIKDEMREFLQGVASALEKRHGQAWPGGTTPKTLSKRSGDLVGSIRGSIKVSGASFSDLSASIGAAFPASVHEFGAVIRARNAKFLTIPLPAALDSRGVPLKQSAREWQNTFIAKSKMGNLLIFQKRGSQVVPLYVLKPEVTIPPRLGMRDTIQAGIPYFIDQSVDRVVASVNASKVTA